MPGIGPAMKGGHGMSPVPPKRPFRERTPHQCYGRTLGKRTVAAVAIDAGPQEGVATEESVLVGNGLYLPGRIEENRVSFDTGRHRIRGVHFGCTDVEKIGSCGGWANQVLGS